MVYPYHVDLGAELKKKLIDNKIFVATYWPNVLEWSSENDFEYKLTRYLLPLPIDQRYKSNDFKKIEQLVL